MEDGTTDEVSPPIGTGQTSRVHSPRPATGGSRFTQRSQQSSRFTEHSLQSSRPGFELYNLPSQSMETPTEVERSRVGNTPRRLPGGLSRSLEAGGAGSWVKLRKDATDSLPAGYGVRSKGFKTINPAQRGAVLGTDLTEPKHFGASVSRQLIQSDSYMELSPWGGTADVDSPFRGSSPAALGQNSPVVPWEQPGSPAGRSTLPAPGSITLRDLDSGPGRNVPAGGKSPSKRPGGLPDKPWEKSGEGVGKHSIRALVFTPYSDRSESSGGSRYVPSRGAGTPRREGKRSADGSAPISGSGAQSGGSSGGGSAGVGSARGGSAGGDALSGQNVVGEKGAGERARVRAPAGRVAAGRVTSARVTAGRDTSRRAGSEGDVACMPGSSLGGSSGGTSRGNSRGGVSRGRDGGSLEQGVDLPRSGSGVPWGVATPRHVTPRGVASGGGGAAVTPTLSLTARKLQSPGATPLLFSPPGQQAGGARSPARWEGFVEERGGALAMTGMHTLSSRGKVLRADNTNSLHLLKARHHVPIPNNTHWVQLANMWKVNPAPPTERPWPGGAGHGASNNP
ncbi:hypothetical protein T484DRAFT_1965417 [Baffinella frigidus]|nr:hypothetical protein T484DRAFT_1965417 [Cryptophyta sp. CCMP2293]